MKFTYLNRTFDIEGASQDDHIYRQIKKNDTFYEEDLLKYMHEFLRIYNKKNNTLAVDVGANIGNHSIYFRSFLSNHLIAIEPNQSILPILQRNLDQNIDNFTIVECGVGEREAMATISLPKDVAGNVGSAKLSFGTKGEAVKVTTIDLIIAEYETINKEHFELSLIKLDVEGMELAALKGAEKTISKYKPHIFAEAATPEEYSQLNNYLKKLGYRKLSKWAVTPVYHFAFKPTLFLLLRTYTYMKFSRIEQIKTRLIRRLVS